MGNQFVYIIIDKYIHVYDKGHFTPIFQCVLFITLCFQLNLVLLMLWSIETVCRGESIPWKGTDSNTLNQLGIRCGCKSEK